MTQDLAGEMLDELTIWGLSQRYGPAPDGNDPGLRAALQLVLL